MVKYRPHIAFTFLMIVYLITRYLRSTGDHLSPFVQFYLTDLLFVPAMCCFALIFMRILHRDATLIIPLHYVLIQTILISAFFEWYLPTYGYNGNIYTFDPYDILCYFCGAILYILLQHYYFRAKAKTLSNSPN